MIKLDIEHLLLLEKDVVVMTDDQMTAMIDWEILEEERLEAKILIWMDDEKKKMLKRFDEDFAPIYLSELESKESVKFLSNIDIGIVKTKYNTVGQFKFTEHIMPPVYKEWFQKQSGLGAEIESVSHINADPFKESLSDSEFRAYYAGGQTSFTILNIPISFNLLDEDAEKRLISIILELSDKVSLQIQSAIKWELLEGIRNFESIPQLRDRILRLWDNPILVEVPAKIKNGKVIRAGYSYNLSAEQWANTVARTEVTRAFQLGRIDAYKQTGLVTHVEHAVTPDERLCAICAPMAGNIYTLEVAQGVFPVHANCRCTPIPIVNYDGERPVSELMTDNVRAKYIEAGLISAQ